MYIINVLLFVALFIGSLSFLTGEPGKITLKIGFITPFFPGLNFLGIEKDSGISPSQSCQDIAESFVKSGVVAVIGAYRSICSMKAADVLGEDQNMIPQISYASTSSKLSEVSSAYKYFFRTAPSNVAQAIAIVALIKLYKWKKVCTIATDDVYGRNLTELVLAELSKTNVSVTVTETFQVRAHAGIVRPKVAKLKRDGCHVGLVFMVRNDAEVVFQQLRELEMVGRDWVWIGSDKATTSVFEDAANLQDAMQGVIGVHPRHGEGRLFDQFMLAIARREASRYSGRKM
ncbi:metabotropic glutamate receptor 2-like [Xenia sp. Carnegie-2017]|uniref:metabotropic glutamate receptor 2-like n=1 Tax=Xenia sp. Carnegie-2017 TaxID=2897299 RepID=UPI001F048E70|nr:metabotropic glutamate receptor 2-like [Xenia sp. Carnegie-2017]